jgi:hypothetical protein
MAFAVLLAVFATGAAIGALFATHAAPGERDGAEVASGSYTAGPDDSLSSSPKGQPEVGGSEAAGVRRVQHLVDLNLEDRFVSGDPDLRTAGEEQRLP